MNANIPGSCLTERAGPGTVLRARAATFEERKKTEEMKERLIQGKADVAGDLDRNKSYRRHIAKDGKTEGITINEKGESYEDRFCSSDK